MGLRYVVLHHTGWIEDHFDLMLERDCTGLLQTWRLEDFPIPKQITRLADHRREYLDYEGPVSNKRGHVKRVAAGMYELTAQTPQFITIRLLPDAIELTLPMQ